MPIRDAVKDDLARIVQIYNDSIPGRAATADTVAVTVQSRVEWFESHESSSRPLWVMEVATDRGPAIAGWISLRDYYGRPAYHATAEIALYIAPEHQGHGYGSKLLGQLIEHAAKHGVRNLLSFVLGHNESSIRLNQRFGFQKWGNLPGVAHLDDDWRDLVILGLKLHADADADGESDPQSSGD